MKIGLSLGRCVRDIFEQKVSCDEVLVIVTRTCFDPTNDQDWELIWLEYTLIRLNVWRLHRSSETQVRELVLALYNSGKIHQPRKFGDRGYNLSTLRVDWLETIIPEEHHATRPAVKKAWDNYKLIAGLS